MKLFNWFKRKKSDTDIFREKMEEHQYMAYDLYSPELLEWIGATNDPVLLASAYHLINCWDWPDYLPKPKDEYDIKKHGWLEPRDYKSIVFTQKLMEQLKTKSEMLSPGLFQSLWMSRYYQKYSTKKVEVPTSSPIEKPQCGVGENIT